MKRFILIGIFILGLTQAVFAYGDWINLTKTQSERIDFKYAKCYYKDRSGNYNVSIVIKGGKYSCPYSIQYDPRSGQWKK